jgi:hypothetical protein
MADFSNFRFKAADLGIFNTKDVNKVLSGFTNGSRIMGLTRGDFSLIDLIHGVLKKTGRAKVTCVTWSAGIKDAHNVKWLVDSDLIERFTLVTDHSYATRQRKYAVSIEEAFGKENIRTSEIHAKFCLIENDDFKVCIRTSMNLNANRTCESFELDENKEIFDFYNKFVIFINENQKEGFVKSSAKVNKTLDLFFGSSQEKKMSTWSDL